MSQKILLIDDERAIRSSLRDILEYENYQVEEAENAVKALEILKDRSFDVIFCDIKMPQMDGLEFLEKVKTSVDAPIIMISGHGTIETAVEALKKGAYDFIEKPLDLNRLLVSVRNALEKKSLVAETKILKSKIHKSDDIIGDSPELKAVLDMADKVAPTDARVLICGENGTGKELLARRIHNKSLRADQPLIEVNCAAIPSELIESELFGHESGSFTGAVAMRRGRVEQADGGTLFLDEVGGLSPELQVKLLRTLQERRFERVGGTEDIEVDIRMVAATNKKLTDAVVAGAFREDLFYSLSIINIPLPPLRERREDIPVLVAHFSEKVSKENGIPHKSFSTEALNYLTGYEWPGNIRQLQNVVERCLVLGSGNEITLDNLPPEIRDEEAQFKSAVDLLPVRLDLADTLEKIEAALIRRALARSEFVQVKAAELLGISKSLLQYKLKKYAITGH